MVVFLLLIIRTAGWLEGLELSILDYLTRIRSTTGELGKPDERLLIVEISEKDIGLLGEWPLSDGSLAATLEKILSFDPALVGVDMYRDLVREGRESLTVQLKSPKVIVVDKLGIPKGAKVEAPKEVPPNRVGFSDIQFDNDGTIRRGLLYSTSEEGTKTSFAMQLAIFYLWKQGITLKTDPESSIFHLGNALFSPLKPNSGGYQNVDTGGYQILLTYRANGKVARQVLLTDILNNKVPAEWIKDKIVLIGTTAPSGQDRHFTPFSRYEQEEALMPGVVIHGHLLSQIINAALAEKSNERVFLFQFWTEWQEILLLIVCGMSGILLGWKIKEPIVLLGGVIVGLIALFGGGYLFFINGFWLPIASTVSIFLGGSTAVVFINGIYQAFYDRLTGLPGRLLLVRILHRQQRRATRLPADKLEPTVAILLLEIENLSVINAVVGAEVGEQLLVNLIARLQNRVKSFASSQQPVWMKANETEFALLLKKPAVQFEITHLAEQICYQASLPIRVKDEDFYLLVNLGIALEFAGEKHKHLLQEAQIAAIRAKTLETRLETFRIETEKEIEDFHLERKLRREIKLSNLKNGAEPFPQLPDFPVYYQAIIDLQTGKLAGFEALMRWQPRNQAMISPVQFIPIAEKTGMIVKLGEWILYEASRQTLEWQQRFNLPDLFISVNLSAKQLAHASLGKRIIALLKEINLPPENLKLEITERLAVANFDATISILNVLRDIGVRFSLDDFGTGYSALSYLNHLPLNTLKIDGSFVQELTTDRATWTVTKTIINLGHDLQMDIVAEGVETTEQQEALHILNCEYGQGFLFSKPLPPAEIEKKFFNIN